MSSIEGGAEIEYEGATISVSVVSFMIGNLQLLLGELGPWCWFYRFSQTIFKSLLINLFSFSTICPPRDIESEQFPQAGSVASLIHQRRLHREFLLT